MFSPVDKQQEHRLLPVECPQKDSFRSTAIAGRLAFRLTGILRAWQHTLATSAATRGNLQSFLSQEAINDGDGSMRAPNSFFPAPFFRFVGHNFSREPARSRTNAPHRIERLPEDHFRFRPADLARREVYCFRRFPAESRPGSQRSPSRPD